MLSPFQIQLSTMLKFMLCKFLPLCHGSHARVVRNVHVTKLSKYYSVVYGEHRTRLGNWINILSAFSLPLNRCT